MMLSRYSMAAFHRMAMALLFVVPAIDAAAAEPKRPNILFIFSDDHAWQAISAYGESRKLLDTPNLVVRLDTEEILRAGLDPDVIARDVRNRIAGVEATTFNEIEKRIDIAVRFPTDERRDLSGVLTAPVAVTRRRKGRSCATLPASTVSPGWCSTGRDSPVSRASCSSS